MLLRSLTRVGQTTDYSGKIFSDPVTLQNVKPHNTQVGQQIQAELTT